MDFKSFNQKKNAFVDVKVFSCYRDECGVFDFSPEYFRREFAFYNPVHTYDESLSVLHALLRFYRRSIVRGVDMDKVDLFDALQYAYLYTCLSNDDEFLDGKLFFEYMRVFLGDKPIIIRDMDDLLLYTTIITSVDRLPIGKSCSSMIARLYPPVLNFIKRISPYLHPDRWGENAFTKETLHYFKNRANSYLDHFDSFNSDRATFLEHLCDANLVLRYHLYLRDNVTGYSEDEFKQARQVLLNRPPLRKFFPNLLEESESIVLSEAHRRVVRVRKTEWAKPFSE